MIRKRVVCIILVVFVWMHGYSQEIKRVISLAPSITKNIYSLNAQDLLVGCTSYCTDGVADGKEIVGSAVNVNVEKIFSLKPDLILTMTLTKTQDVAALKRLGLNVKVIQTPKSFEEICRQTLQLGELVGREKDSERLVTETAMFVDSLIQKSLQIPKKSKIFFQIGANPIFTVLQNTFMDDYILFCNGENIANGLTKGTMTRESVILKKPDVIIISTMGGMGKDEINVWSSYKGLEAAKNSKIFLIESNISCSPTPENFAKSLSQIYNFIIQ